MSLCSCAAPSLILATRVLFMCPLESVHCCVQEPTVAASFDLGHHAQNLVPSMREPHKWDLLIGHYLGVDHVGHTYDVHSPHMASKLQQMNEHVDQVRCACTSADDCSLLDWPYSSRRTPARHVDRSSLHLCCQEVQPVLIQCRLQHA